PRATSDGSWPRPIPTRGSRAPGARPRRCARACELRRSAGAYGPRRVFVFADNRTSAELGLRALGRGLPVMIEKPMAADLAGADALLAAGRATGLPLMVNWPTAWRPVLRHGLALVRSGAVGEPVQLSHRRCHAGPR